MIPPTVAVLDACVLYPILLRRILAEVAAAGLYRARWSDRIEEEWVLAVQRNHPDLEDEVLEGEVEALHALLPEGHVTGYRDLVREITLPDRDDRHVLAAAIRCEADLILTMDLRHFPKRRLRPHGVEARHPDAFLSALLRSNRDRVLSVLRHVRQTLFDEPIPTADFLLSIERSGLRHLLKDLRPHREFI